MDIPGGLVPWNKTSSRASTAGADADADDDNSRLDSSRSMPPPAPGTGNNYSRHQSSLNNDYSNRHLRNRSNHEEYDDHQRRQRQRQQEQEQQEDSKNYKRKRNYRYRMDETPSYTGGINRDVEKRVRDKERQKQQGRYHHSREYNPRRQTTSDSIDGSRISGSSSRKEDRYSSNASGRESRSQWESPHRKHPTSTQFSKTRKDQGKDRSVLHQDHLPRYANSTPMIPQNPGSSSLVSMSTATATSATVDSASLSEGGWENDTPMRPRWSNSQTQRSSSSVHMSSVRAFPGSGENFTPVIVRPMGKQTLDVKSDPSRYATQEEEDDEFDRQFYLVDDDEFLLDEGETTLGRFLYESSKTKQREEMMEKQRQEYGYGAVSTRMTMENLQQQQQHQQQSQSTLKNAKRNALQDDQEAWETSRLLSSGAAVRGQVDLDFSRAEEDTTRVTLLVHQVKPPFLGTGGASGFSTVKNAVPTVKDNTSDFAKMAREGSETLRRLREKKERNTMRNKFWQIGGSRMGEAVGVKEVEEGKESGTEGKEGDDEEDVQGEVDYRKTSGFASHLKLQDEEQKSEAVSDFAKEKSIRQQREYLPAFTVRDELLNVIRENNVIVVVGETGSGKTTQLTQYLMEEGYTEYGIVGCTQPRRVAAMSVAKRVSEEVAAGVKEKGIPLGEKDKLGGTVGYAIRFEDMTSVSDESIAISFSVNYFGFIPDF